MVHRRPVNRHRVLVLVTPSAVRRASPHARFSREPLVSARVSRNPQLEEDWARLAPTTQLPAAPGEGRAPAGWRLQGGGPHDPAAGNWAETAPVEMPRNPGAPRPRPRRPAPSVAWRHGAGRNARGGGAPGWQGRCRRWGRGRRSGWAASSPTERGAGPLRRPRVGPSGSPGSLQPEGPAGSCSDPRCPVLCGKVEPRRAHLRDGQAGAQGLAPGRARRPPPRAVAPEPRREACECPSPEDFGGFPQATPDPGGLPVPCAPAAQPRAGGAGAPRCRAEGICPAPRGLGPADGRLPRSSGAHSAVREARSAASVALVLLLGTAGGRGTCQYPLTQVKRSPGKPHQKGAGRWAGGALPPRPACPLQTHQEAGLDLARGHCSAPGAWEETLAHHLSPH